MTAVKLSELAARVNGEPYELDLEDGGGFISIQWPTIAQWEAAVKAPTAEGFALALNVAAADAARLGQVMPGQGMGTEGALVVSVRRHFGLKN
jgi:hypothetical protein